MLDFLIPSPTPPPSSPRDLLLQSFHDLHHLLIKAYAPRHSTQGPLSLLHLRPDPKQSNIKPLMVLCTFMLCSILTISSSLPLPSFYLCMNFFFQQIQPTHHIHQFCPWIQLTTVRKQYFCIPTPGFSTADSQWWRENAVQ